MFYRFYHHNSEVYEWGNNSINNDFTGQIFTSRSGTGQKFTVDRLRVTMVWYEILLEK